MKNLRIESYKKSAKIYKRTALARNSYDPLRKIVVFHRYTDDTGNQTKEFSWWDDVSFVHGAYYISVCWTHPRYDYHEKCDSLAYDEADKKFPNRHSLFDNEKVFYKKVGKSRKKVSHHVTSFPESKENFYETWKETREEILKTGDVSIPTSFSVRQTSWSKLVEICIPIEVRNLYELSRLCSLVKVYLDDPVQFVKDYRGYRYTKESWLSDDASKVSGN